jgi:ATP-binding cassette subfamily B (MDR/TAP) protein 1
MAPRRFGTFRYPTRPDTQVPQGLSLEVEAGKTLVLLGESRMGKSTIAALLLRFYDSDRAVVRIDNYDVRCVNLNHLRMNVGLVSQEPALFKTSFKDNILYGPNSARYLLREFTTNLSRENLSQVLVVQLGTWPTS